MTGKQGRRGRRIHVQRRGDDSSNVSTVNFGHLVDIYFVWYPGAANIHDSLIDLSTTTAPRPRYTWQPSGGTPKTREMIDSWITIPLPPGGRGTLTAFDTTWEIRRTPLGDVNMSAVNTIRGVQERLNCLGYHLRAPGARSSGVSGMHGRLTEIAILAFQTDYRRPDISSSDIPNPPFRLQVRGEWINNPNIQANLNRYNRTPAGNNAANPSGVDGLALQSALLAIVQSALAVVR